MSIGHSALSTAKQGLTTTSHNIANANTEGYSRQRVEQRTLPPVTKGNIAIGTGVTVRSIKRVHDQLVENKMQKNIADHQFNEERSFQLGVVEEIYNEVNSDGLSNVINKFFNSFRELANTPEDETVRSVVRENARVVIEDIKSIRANLNKASNDIDSKLRSSVEDVNNLLQNIAKLNVQISEVENSALETGDLRDQRDLALRTLSEYFEITTYADEKNNFTVNAKGVGTLLTGAQVLELATVVRPPEEGMSNKDYEPSLDIAFASKPGHILSRSLRGGQIGALFKTRDENVNNLQNHVDEIAFELANMTNAIHRRGFANKSVPVDENGNSRPDLTAEKVTGLDFFKIPKDKYRAAEYFDLSDDVKSDLRNIVTAYDANSPGDNRIAIAISKIQHAKLLAGGTATLEEHYLSAVGDLSVQAGKSTLDATHSEGVLAQTKSLKERISGVSLDEEATNIVKYQQAYDASARVMNAANQTFKSVLDLV